MANAWAEMAARGWPEDASHENGNYECLCYSCSRPFIGHKRRVACKPCSDPSLCSHGIKLEISQRGGCTPCFVTGEINMKTKKPVVADIWASLVSKPGLGQRTGKEQIVDKGWINDKGELIHHGMGQTHQEWAIAFLRDTKDPAAETPEGRNPMQVDDILLKRGYIRVQIYANGGMGLQGLAQAVKSYGHAALVLLPRPKRVYVMDFPTGETSLYTADELAAIGLA